MFTITISKSQFVCFIVFCLIVICGAGCYSAGYKSGCADVQVSLRKASNRVDELQTELDNLRDSINGRGIKIAIAYRMAN